MENTKNNHVVKTNKGYDDPARDSRKPVFRTVVDCWGNVVFAGASDDFDMRGFCQAQDDAHSTRYRD